MLAPWQSSSIGDVHVTALPAKHGVPEIGFVVQGSGFTVYFGGDTLLIPDLSEIAQRFPDLDVALLPINGLHVFGKQVAMNPAEAAELCAMLRPTTAIPTHYAFNGGLTDGIMLKYYADPGRLPDLFQVLIEYAPETRAVLLQPAEAVTLQPSERKAPEALLPGQLRKRLERFERHVAWLQD